MAKLIVRHDVQDYGKWREIFDDHEAERREFGSTGFEVLRSAGDPNDITVIMEWPEVDSAKRFAESDSLKEAMKDAGVISQPDVNFLVEA